jgi:hypothetical protein
MWRIVVNVFKICARSWSLSKVILTEVPKSSLINYTQTNENGETREIYRPMHSTPNIVRVIREMSGAFSTYGGEETCVQGISGET